MPPQIRVSDVYRLGAYQRSSWEDARPGPGKRVVLVNLQHGGVATGRCLLRDGEAPQWLEDPEVDPRAWGLAARE